MNTHSHRKNQRGFVMLYVLIASGVIFTLLSMGIQASRALHETNKRHTRELSERAAHVIIRRDKN